MLVHELSTAVYALLVNGDYMLAEIVGSSFTGAIRVNHAAAEHLCCVVILNPFQESYLLWRANNLFRESRNES